jgi:hypothetical protein
VPLLSPREKMPFELTPVSLHLTYEPVNQARAAGDQPGEPPAQNTQTAAR